ncbi:MAG TPA: ribosome maturation factor RimM [Armatimonadota bacterium]|jgi:16S rRNA processing protein RimM
MMEPNAAGPDPSVPAAAEPTAEPPREPEVEVGKVVGVFGIKGEVKVEAYSDSPARYAALKAVTAVWPDGRRRALAPVGSRKHKTHILMRFEGVPNPNEAETLRGAALVIPLSERAPLPPHQYYISDLIGLTVVTTAGEEIGPITDVLKTPANDIYVTARGLIPAVRQFVKQVDLEQHRVVVAPLPGMFDEKPPSSAD